MLGTIVGLAGSLVSGWVSGILNPAVPDFSKENSQLLNNLGGQIKQQQQNYQTTEGQITAAIASAQAAEKKKKETTMLIVAGAAAAGLFAIYEVMK